MNLRIEKNKRIGRVLFLVEGDEDEANLLEAIFCNALGYGLIRYDKRDGSVREYGKMDDPYSRVFVVPMPTPSIVHLPIDEERLDDIYHILAAYGLGGMEAATYYLFDRDWRSNMESAVLSKIELLRNPYDNGIEMPGALLLSYPCLQAYYCQAHGKTVDFSESHDAKVYVNTNRLKTIEYKEVLTAASNALIALASIRNKPLGLSELSDYSGINKDVFSYEKASRSANGMFLTLSLLSLALIDLGVVIIEETDPIVPDPKKDT